MKAFLTGIALIFATASMAQTMTEWKDMEVNNVNRLPVHTSLFPFESVEASRHDMTESSRFMSIDGTWKFWWTANGDDKLPEGFNQPGFDDSSWGDMAVPGMWELQKNPQGKTTIQRHQNDPYGVPVYVNSGFTWHGQYKNNPPMPPMEKNHTGIYRRSFRIPSGWQGEQVIMHLGSVSSCVYVWVNGKFTGYSEDSKIATEFDITPYLQRGENLIAMEVHRWCDGSYCEDQDCWRMTGIARQSYLYARNKTTHIDNLRTTADMNGQLNIMADITGNAKVHYSLADRDGKVVADTTVATPKAGTMATQIQVNNPNLWSAEMPYLYTLTAELMANDKAMKAKGKGQKSKGKGVNVQNNVPTEVMCSRVGFRTVEMKNAQLLVNGKAILIKGVDRHEIDPDGGFVISLDRMISDIKRLKQFNFNAVRTCHYPDDPRWYDLCDEYGIYLCAEANMESHGFGYNDKNGVPPAPKTPLFAKQIMERNQNNVMTQFNHPAIITWSMGNETVDGPNFTAVFQWIKSFDKTRAVQWHPTRQGPNTEIFCPMYMTQADAEKYAADPEKTRPIIQCEYSHAMGNSGGGFKEYWDLIRKYPKYQGGFIWDFADQGLRKEPYSKTYFYGGDYDSTDPSDNNFNCNGVFQPDRTPTPQAYEIKYQQQNVWTTPVDLAQGKVSIFNENFFRPLDYVTMHWQLTKDGELSQEGDIDVSKLNIQPQQKAELTIPYTVPAGAGEVLLNVSYRLKAVEPMIGAGYEVAHQQMAISNYSYTCNDIPTADLAKLNAQLEKNLANNEKKGVKAKFVCPASMTFENIRPDFWRAPTDNDMGAGINKKYQVWNDPQLVLRNSAIASGKALFFDKKEDVSIMTNIYDMPEVNATLTMTFTSLPGGIVRLDQTLEPKADAKDIPNMMRFGILADLPQDAQELTYYGRGPQENYNDRCSGAPLAIYAQDVNEQFFPYIRPQETGTKTDVRWLKIGGYRILSDKSFSFSALNYTQDSLDETKAEGKTNRESDKHQRHPWDVKKADHVELALNSEMTGVGGINSWTREAEALPQYRVNYGKKALTLYFIPE